MSRLLAAALALPTCLLTCLLTCLIVLLARPAPSLADVIDFETGFEDLDEVSLTVETATNRVRFRFGAGKPMGNGFIARVGAPLSAFYPADQPSGGNPGAFFLTDERGGRRGPRHSLDCFLEFAQPVANLSLELYDLEVDGNTATLRAWSDLGRTNLVGMDRATISGKAPEGLVTPLSIPRPSSVIRAASVTLSSRFDTGTGIDNVRFTTARVPIPKTALLAVGGMLFATSFLALGRA